MAVGLGLGLGLGGFTVTGLKPHFISASDSGFTLEMSVAGTR
jgi:hypothetical protein